MINMSMIPQEFVEKYNLKGKAHNRYIFAQVTKWVYGIPKAGQKAHDVLLKHLEPYEYRPSSKTLGLWTHESQTIKFTFVVDKNIRENITPYT